jgi:RNA polymerase sigma-70 factor, ECF subfamily
VGEPVADETLLLGIAEGSRDALRILFERHSPWLLLRLGRRCGDRAAAEEALQDTFVAVWRKPQSFKGGGAVGAWLWGIAVRRLIDILRRRRPEVAFEAGLVASAEEQVMTNLEHGELSGALRELAPELRQVVQATVLDGLTTREAAHLLGIPQGTVKTRMHRARRELRSALV